MTEELAKQATNTEPIEGVPESKMRSAFSEQRQGRFCNLREPEGLSRTLLKIFADTEMHKHLTTSWVLSYQLSVDKIVTSIGHPNESVVCNEI